MILFNGESLAYLGDAIYETEIRKHVLTKGVQDVNRLHKEAIKYTSGEAQAKIIERFLSENVLSEEELTYYKRGRNSSHSKNRRNISVVSYKMATGFEALIGYLYYAKQENRLEEIIQLAISYVEEEAYGKKGQ